MSGVSIIMPVYNTGKYLRETLDCLLAQTYPQWTCICVDDGSTDNSVEIIQEYCDKDNRFRVYTKPNEKSADLARAYGIERADSEWIMYLDSDDIIEPSYIEKMVSRQKETNADVVSPTMIFCRYELEGEIWRLPCAPIRLSDVIDGKDAFRYTIGGWKLAAGGMMYRGTLDEGVYRGPYMCSDEFSSRLILYEAERVAFSDAIYTYRQNRQSTSRRLSSRIWGRVYVDRQLEDFVFDHFSGDEKLLRLAQKGAFFNLVYLTYLYYSSCKYIEAEERQGVKEALQTAYKSIKKERISKYLPSHSKYFMHGYKWFATIAVIYHTAKRILREEPYMCK